LIGGSLAKERIGFAARLSHRCKKLGWWKLGFVVRSGGACIGIFKSLLSSPVRVETQSYGYVARVTPGTSCNWVWVCLEFALNRAV
jgi:hypothetical protein